MFFRGGVNFYIIVVGSDGGEGLKEYILSYMTDKEKYAVFVKSLLSLH